MTALSPSRLSATEAERPCNAQFGDEIVGLTPVLRKFALLLYRNNESAADLVQETLAKAWQARGSFVPGTNLKAWLFAIMRNQFHSEARRNWRQMPWNEAAAANIAAPPSEQLWSVELEDAARAIEALSAKQRKALILSAVGGLSSKELGAVLLCHPSAAKSRVCRARQAIAAMLDGKEPFKRKRNGEKSRAAADLVYLLDQLTATRGRHAAAA